MTENYIRFYQEEKFKFDQLLNKLGWTEDCLLNEVGWSSFFFCKKSFCEKNIFSKKD